MSTSPPGRSASRRQWNSSACHALVRHPNGPSVGVVGGATDLLGGFPGRDPESAPSCLGARYTLADLPVRAAVTPVAQGGAHDVIPLWGGADQIEHVFGFHGRLLLGLRPVPTG